MRTVVLSSLPPSDNISKRNLQMMLTKEQSNKQLIINIIELDQHEKSYIKDSRHRKCTSTEFKWNTQRTWRRPVPCMWRWNNAMLIVQLQSIPKSSNNSSLGKGYILTLQGDDNWLLPRVTNISLFLRVHIQAVNSFFRSQKENALPACLHGIRCKNLFDFLPFLILDQAGELTSARIERYLVAKGRQSYNCPAQWTLFWWAIWKSNSRH